MFQAGRILIPPGSTYIEFDQVEVPVSNLLGQENKGFPIIMSSKIRAACLKRTPP
jgi:hypothetical protein